jgi:hypothetical protein
MQQKTKVKKRTNQTIVLRIQSDEMLRFGSVLLNYKSKSMLYCSRTSGVVETGLFVNMAKHVVFGKQDGSVETRDA